MKKTQLIDEILKIVEKHGTVCTDDIDEKIDDSKIKMTFGKSVTITSEDDLYETDFEYAELEDDTLANILYLVECYDTDMEKTFKRCAD